MHTNKPRGTHPSLLKRKIIHFDMDCFYAAVEMRDNPRLQGKPLIVGGSPNSRGVVCTASYEARRYGVHSAMACAHAKRLCPNGIFIAPNFEKYQQVSHNIRSIFQKYTDLIEPLSLDEAYLDVTDNKKGLFAVKIAKLIQKEIYKETGLTGSAGIAPNKLLAKIASDFQKPSGLTLILPEQTLSFMQPLSLRTIPGVGPASEKKLSALGLSVCDDVWRYSLAQLQAMLGLRMGGWLYHWSRGIDERHVQTQRVRKSLGKEDTFTSDVSDVAILHEKLDKLAETLTTKLSIKALAGRTVTLKVKYANFTQITRSKTLAYATNDKEIILNTAQQLMVKTAAGSKKIRLLGISLSKLIEKNRTILHEHVG